MALGTLHSVIPEATVVAPLILATVLVFSGIGKIRDDDAATERSWEDLGVPLGLNVRRLRRSHPWAEILLAIALVAAPAWLGVATAGASVALCAFYLVLIARAAARPEPASCDCFGSGAPTVISARTVARNVVLLLLALMALVHALQVGSPAQVLATAPASTWWWLAAVGLAALTTYLVLPQVPDLPQVPEADAPSAPGTADDDSDSEYIRTLTPMTTLVDAAGTRYDLVSMSAQRAHLLVFVNPGCGGCAPVVEKVPRWQNLVPEVQIRLVVRQELADLAASRPDWVPIALHDPDGLTARALRAISTPTAVLLGTDGMLAGGPVAGSEAVEHLVLDVVAELEQARTHGAEAVHRAGAR